MEGLLSPELVTTGLDPVVHGSRARPFGGMDPRIKVRG